MSVISIPCWATMILGPGYEVYCTVVNKACLQCVAWAPNQKLHLFAFIGRWSTGRAFERLCNVMEGNSSLKLALGLSPWFVLLITFSLPRVPTTAKATKSSRLVSVGLPVKFLGWHNVHLFAFLPSHCSGLYALGSNAPGLCLFFLIFPETIYASTSNLDFVVFSFILFFKLTCISTSRSLSCGRSVLHVKKRIPVTPPSCLHGSVE